VRESQLWKLNLATSKWESATITTGIRRAWGGAVASVPSSKRGYFLGGIVENRTDIAFTNAPGYEYLGDSFLTFDSGSATFSNKTYSTAGASTLGSIGLGNLVHIPGIGQEGILVFIGGAQGPSQQWVPTGTILGVELRDMTKVWVHDIASNRWYEQDTALASGLTQGPAGRISACAVVVPAPDKSSWNIFVYGGGDLDPNSSEVYGDTWVLSLPSFTWIQADTKGEERFEHTCHLVKGSQMLVVGGRDKQQDSAGDPAKNYTTSQADWTCLKQGILSSLDLNTLAWTNSLPATDVDYQVSSVISKVIGGKYASLLRIVVNWEWELTSFYLVQMVAPRNASLTTVGVMLPSLGFWAARVHLHPHPDLTLRMVLILILILVLVYLLAPSSVGLLGV